MKTFSSRARFVACQSTQMGMVCLALMLGAIVLSAGCGKKSAPPVSNTSPAQTNQEAVSSQPAPAAPGSAENSQPVPPTTSAEPAPTDLKELNHALLRWVVQNHYRPKSFEDFVARSNIQVPPPPAGKKYVIQRGFIVLVDSSSN